MSEYDKRLMEIYTRVYAAAISAGERPGIASDYARRALDSFEATFERPIYEFGGR